MPQAGENLDWNAPPKPSIVTEAPAATTTAELHSAFGPSSAAADGAAADGAASSRAWIASGLAALVFGVGGFFAVNAWSSHVGTTTTSGGPGGFPGGGPGGLPGGGPGGFPRGGGANGANGATGATGGPPNGGSPNGGPPNGGPPNGGPPNGFGQPGGRGQAGTVESVSADGFTLRLTDDSAVAVTFAPATAETGS